MPWYFQFLFNIPNIFFSQKNSSVFFDFLFINNMFKWLNIDYVAVDEQLELFEVSKALILKTWNLRCNFKAFRIIKGNFINNID